MDVDEQTERVMPNGGATDKGANAEGVVVPRGDGEASSAKEREALAALPVAPVNGAAEGTAEADALMEEVEDLKEHVSGATGAENDDEEEEAGDDDDLFGCVDSCTEILQSSHSRKAD